MSLIKIRGIFGAEIVALAVNLYLSGSVCPVAGMKPIVEKGIESV